MLRRCCGAALVALALAVGLALVGPVSAQPSPVLSGTVTGPDGRPIASASVAVLNTTAGAATDADGRFSLPLPAGPATVRVSAVGYSAVVRAVTVPGTVRVRLARADQALGDVVVTAQRDEQALADAPVAVTVIGGDQVEDARIWDVADLSGRVPSYLYQESGVGFQALQSIRGVQVFSENPAVTTVVDGVTGVDILAGGIALADVERIEVLRGPQTTLFGRNALGGVVNVVTRPPSNAWAASAEASGGSDGLGRLGAAVRGPVVPGRLFAAASALARTRDGYFENDTTGTAAPLPSAAGAEVGSEASLYGNASLRWLPSPRWSAALNVKAQLDDSDASGFFVGAASDEVARETPDRLSLARVGQHTRDLANGALTVRYAAPSVDVSSTSTVQRIGLSFRDIDSGGIYDSFADGERGGRSVQTVLSQEIRATTAGRDAPVQATAGLFGFAQTAREPTTNLAFRLGDDLFSIFRNRARNAGAAVYGQATAEVAPGVAVTAGLRYDVERREATFNGFGDASLSGGVVTEVRPDTTVSGIYGAFSPKLALTVALGESASAYASYTRGFRAGGVNAQRVRSDQAAYTYDPETSDNLEVGARVRLGARVTASATAFAIWWDDLQFFNLVAAPFTFARENVGDARSQGLEFELAAVPVVGLRLDASLSVLDVGATTYRRFVLTRLDDQFRPAETDVTGNRLANAPAHTASLAARYRVPVRPGLAAFVQGQARSVGGFFTDIQNDLRQDAALTLDASAGVEAGRFQASVWAENLTDQRALVFGAPDTSFSRRSLAGPPRAVGLTLRARY